MVGALQRRVGPGDVAPLPRNGRGRLSPRAGLPGICGPEGHRASCARSGLRPPSSKPELRSRPPPVAFMTSRGCKHGDPWLKPREVMNGGCGARKPDLGAAECEMVPMVRALAAHSWARLAFDPGGGEARTGRLGVQRGSEVSEARPELRELLASVCSAGLGVRVLAGSVPRQPTDPTCMERLSG